MWERKTDYTIDDYGKMIKTLTVEYKSNYDIYYEYYGDFSKYFDFKSNDEIKRIEKVNKRNDLINKILEKKNGK